MKISLLFVLMICWINVIFGQTDFQKLTLDAACQKAKMENKLVFVDLYTSWCAPCKIMAEKVFPDARLGEFMNRHFVCVKYDTGTDQDGKELVNRFNIQAYPTFLFLNANKELENQIVGATLEPSDFINQVQFAMKSSLASLEQQYMRGNREIEFLTDYLKTLLAAFMNTQAKDVCAALFEVLPDEEKSSRNYWFIFNNQELAPIGSNVMDFLFAHYKQFVQDLGEEKVLNRVSEAFEIKLRDMIRGREKMDDLEKVVRQMQPLHFNSRERMDVYVKLAESILVARKTPTEGAIEKLLIVCEQEFPKIDGEHLVYFYFPVTIFIASNGNQLQKERVDKLNQYIREHTDHTPLKIGLGNMLHSERSE